MGKKKGKKGGAAKKRRKERRQANQQSAASAPTVQPSAPPAAANNPQQRNTSNRLLLEPGDVWLFRNGKPFQAGEDHWAASLFPPTPFTIQGVIRSKILFDSHTDLQAYAAEPTGQAVYQQIGGPDSYGQLRLNGPYLAKKVEDRWERYYPVPADLFQDKNDDKQYHRPICADAADEPARGNWPADGLRPLLLPDKVEAEAVNGWISQTALDDYLQAKRLPSFADILNPDAIYKVERRFNHKIDRAVYRPAEQFLTETGFIRLCPGLSLDIDVEGLAPWSQEERYLGIGGEGGTGYYQWLPPAAQQPPGLTTVPARFMLYLATPTWFEQGWQPADWSQWFTGSAVKLVGAAIRPLQRIGGWNIAKITQGKTGQARTMAGYVPAGSLYYLESDGSVTYTGAPVTDDPALGQIGFGQILIGRWPTQAQITELIQH